MIKFTVFIFSKMAACRQTVIFFFLEKKYFNTTVLCYNTFLKLSKQNSQKDIIIVMPTQPVNCFKRTGHILGLLFIFISITIISFFFLFFSFFVGNGSME